MKMHNLGDQDVAAAIGVSRETISRIRRRKVRPEWATIAELRRFSKGVITADDFEMIDPAAMHGRVKA